MECHINENVDLANYNYFLGLMVADGNIYERKGMGLNLQVKYQYEDADVEGKEMNKANEVVEDKVGVEVSKEEGWKQFVDKWVPIEGLDRRDKRWQEIEMEGDPRCKT